MNRNWSNPIPYDLTRTGRRASVPRNFEHLVPETPGTYVIFQKGSGKTADAILDIGECGPRLNSMPHGLKGRLATGVPHSASERIAFDLQRGVVPNALNVVWLEAASKQSAKETQDALITLFVQECGAQPRYNHKREFHVQPDMFQSDFQCLKKLAGCLR